MIIIVLIDMNQLYLHVCNDDEYQCSNSQCIPRSFFRDDTNNSDCLDQSDEIIIKPSSFVEIMRFSITVPTFTFEDTSCVKSLRAPVYDRIFLTSSCVGVRQDLLS
jgi:hypothetical protein